jgi:TetR/AcrR family transcriptional regulator, cholesterol catabolism regulator
MTQNSNERPRKRTSNAKGSARRAQLLGIAAELFATRGYSQTTVRDIADEASILSGSLYHHFESKEAMLREILLDFMETLSTQFAEIVERGESPRESLDGLVRSSFLSIHERPHQVALYQNEVGMLAHLPDFEFVAKASRGIEAVWLQVLAAGRESGDFREDLDSNIVYRFIRDTVWASVRWYNPRGRLRHDKVADQFLAMLHGGLLTR